MIQKSSWSSSNTSMPHNRHNVPTASSASKLSLKNRPRQFQGLKKKIPSRIKKEELKILVHLKAAGANAPNGQFGWIVRS